MASRAGDLLSRAGDGRAATNAHDQEAGGGSGSALKDTAAPLCETGKNYMLGVGDSKELRGGRRGHNEQLKHPELGANRDLHPSLPNMFGIFSEKTGTINALYLNHINPVLASHGIGFGWQAGSRIADRSEGKHPIICPTLRLRRIWSLP